MTSFCLRLKIALAVVAVSSVVVAADQAVVPAPAKRAARKPAAVASRANQIESAISGTALDGNASPLPNASLRLRNLQINKVERTTTSNHAGEFRFIVTPEILYVVELVDHAGQVLAVGDVITPQIGEVAGTIVTLPNKLPARAGLFGGTAGAVLSTTGLGITALPPVSPEK